MTAPLSRLDEARKRSDLERAIAGLETAMKALEASRAEEKRESATELAKAHQSLAEEEKECDDLEKKVNDLTAENASLKSDVKGTERLLAAADKQIKKQQEEKVSMEQMFSKTVSEIRAATEAIANRPRVTPSYELQVTGRDGNNDLQKLKITPKDQ